MVVIMVISDAVGRILRKIVVRLNSGHSTRGHDSAEAGTAYGTPAAHSKQRSPRLKFAVTY